MKAIIDRLDRERRVRIRDGLKPITAEDVPALAAGFKVDDVSTFGEELSTAGVIASWSERAKPGNTSDIASSGQVAVVCPNCSNKYTEAFQFCPNCGTETQAPSPEERSEAQARLLDELVERVAVLEAHEDAAPQSWTWDGVGESQKWKVFWGVWWRWLLFYVGLVIVFSATGFCTAVNF